MMERDPAARSRFEVATLYPGVHAVWGHRLSSALWRRGAKYPARAFSQVTRLITNIEIHPAAVLGPRLVIDHGAGVVVGETAVIGSDVTLYHGVTLGGRSLDPVRRHPKIGDGVLIGTGAAVLGPIEVGEGSRIGANSVVVKSVPAGSVVVGVPAKVTNTAAVGGTGTAAATGPNEAAHNAANPYSGRRELWGLEDYSI